MRIRMRVNSDSGAPTLSVMSPASLPVHTSNSPRRFLRALSSIQDCVVPELSLAFEVLALRVNTKRRELSSKIAVLIERLAKPTAAWLVSHKAHSPLSRTNPRSHTAQSTPVWPYLHCSWNSPPGQSLGTWHFMNSKLELLLR